MTLARAPLDRILNAWTLAVLPLVGLGFADTVVFHQLRKIGDYFFFGQDLAMLLGGGLFLAALKRLPHPAAAPPRIDPSRLTIGIALAAILVARIGAHLIFVDYGMTGDEFMVEFDARIFATGRFFGRVPEAWRSLVHGLQPLLIVSTADHAAWASSYLPVNAAILALANAIGIGAFVGPIWNGVSVLAIAGVARRLWPDQALAGPTAVVLLATSTQFLFNGMTHFAMPAHLAFNLLWLRCFLKGGKLGHLGALVLGFFATGLHQLIFHPLFAAPFVLQMWREKRWRLAGVYSLAYAAIVAVWLFYWPLALHLSGTPPQPAGEGGVVWFASRVAERLSLFQVVNVGSLAKDLARFVAWQNPLTAPLALVAFAGALRAKGTMQALALGVILTLIAMFILLPYQDHGWGYRYLHGLLGSITLLAVAGWTEVTSGLSDRDGARASWAFVASAVFALWVQFPIRAAQVGPYIRPYAAASAAIARADADAVIVDDTISWYALVLVRNDPDLNARPRVLYLQTLTAQNLRDVCRQGSVFLFGRDQARHFGIRDTVPYPGTLATSLRLRGTLKDLGCGTDFPIVATPPKPGVWR